MSEHKWTGQRSYVPGEPDEYDEFCDNCGMNKPGEDQPIPPCPPPDEVCETCGRWKCHKGKTPTDTSNCDGCHEDCCNQPVTRTDLNGDTHGGFCGGRWRAKGEFTSVEGGIVQLQQCDRCKSAELVE